VGEAFVDAARRRIADAGRFVVALAGGNTPRILYRFLALECRKPISWECVELFWTDERLVPPGHPDSNYRMTREALLDHVDIPAANIHRPETERDDPEEAARRYEQRLFDVLGDNPKLDWVLLGLGEDGHVASLFPGSPLLRETDRWVAVVRDSPKPPPIRLTMTLPIINDASEIHFLVTGRAKAEVVRATLEGPMEPERFPAQAVQTAEGNLTWWLDADAASLLKKKPT
jgi:6-phosphogluconolactonase